MTNFMEQTIIFLVINYNSIRVGLLPFEALRCIKFEALL